MSHPGGCDTSATGDSDVTTPDHDATTASGQSDGDVTVSTGRW